MFSNDITSHTTDGSEEENNTNITPVLLDKKDDSSGAEHLGEVLRHAHEEIVLPRSLSESQRDALQTKPHNMDNIVPSLSASSSSSSVS